MNALKYHENKRRGSVDFPLDYHYIDRHHSRYQMPYHWHEEAEILRVRSGLLHLSIGEESYTLSPGDVAYIAPGKLHGGKPENCVYECVVFDLRLLLGSGEACRRQISRMLDGRTEIVPFLPAGSPVTANALQPMFAALHARSDGEVLVTLGSLYLFFGEAIGHGALIANTAAQAAEKSRQMQLKTVFELIENHYAQAITLAQLAGAVGMSPRYFCRFFKEATHRTPMEYIAYYRVEMACYAFAATQESVTDIALDMGFTSLNYFIRCFKKYKGLPPGQYRKALKRRVKPFMQ